MEQIESIGPGCNTTLKAPENKTMRDEFAMFALAGAMVSVGETLTPIQWGELASDCYRAADAMIAAREGGQS